VTSKPFDLAISLPTFFGSYGNGATAEYRRKLYEDCIKSLQNVKDWLGLKVIVVLRDDHSENPPEPPIIPGISLSYLSQPEHLGMDGNCWDALFAARDLGYWTLWLDCDSLVNHNFVRRAFDLVHTEPNAKAYSLFNSKYHRTIEDMGTYVRKSSITELGALFRSADLKTTTPININEDLGSASYWPAAKPSLIQHTGRHGMNNPAGDDFDPDFVL
jgi:hypothetical protein